MTTRLSFLSASILLAICAAPASAVLVGYTNRADFLTDLPGLAQTLDFDTLTAGDLIPDGGTIDGITFNYPALAGFGITLQVRDDFSTTSTPNYLGTDDGGVFQGGDEFELSFAPSNAIGLTFLSTDELLDDDLLLTVGTTTIGLASIAVQETLADGSNVYFLGIINDMAPFTTASVTGSGPFFLYNVDDIVTSAVAIPEPSAFLLTALVGMALRVANHFLKTKKVAGTKFEFGS